MQFPFVLLKAGIKSVFTIIHYFNWFEYLTIQVGINEVVRARKPNKNTEVEKRSVESQKGTCKKLKTEDNVRLSWIGVIMK